MIKKIFFKDAIQKKIIILITTFIFASIFAYSGFVLSRLLEKQFNQRIDNTNNHHHIGMLIIRDLNEIEKFVIQLQKIDNEKKLSFMGKKIFSLLNKINIRILVLREGGTVKDQLSINFMDLDNVENVYQYNPSQKKYNLDVLALGPRIIIIKSAIKEMIDQIKIKLTTKDLLLKKTIQDKINIQMKKINSYLLRSFEDNNKILYDSTQKIIAEHKEHKAFLKKIDLYSTLFYLFTIIGLTLLTINIMKKINSLITERVNAHKQIKELSEENSQIVEVAGPTCIINNDNIIYTVNETFCKFFKKTKEEIIGMKCHEILNSYLCETSDCPLNKCKLSNQLHVSHQKPLKLSNGIRQVQIDAYRLSDKEGKMTGIVETILDITELKRAEEKYHNLFAYSQDAIIMISPPDWKFIDANNQALKMFGAKSHEQFLTLGPVDISPQYQPDGELSSEKAKQNIMHALATGSNYFEFIHKRLNGEEFPATVLISSVEIEDKEILQGTIRDISDIKKKKMSKKK